jgi:N-methylhydantoinase A
LAEKNRRTLALRGGEDAHDSAGLDLRYRGQSYELAVPIGLPATAAEVDAAAQAFHAAHVQRYGYSMPGEELEVVTLRLRTTLAGAQLSPGKRPPVGPDATPARREDRRIWFDAGGPLTVACYARDRLLPGNRVDGPCLVLQYDSTLLLTQGWKAQVDPYGNLVCEKRDSYG